MIFYLFLIFILCFILLSSLVFLFFHVTTIFTGAPYLGINRERLILLIDVASIKKGETTVDLGSGDGRIVIAMAKKGAIAYGYELNPFLVLISWWNIYKAGMWGNAFVIWGDFWKTDLSKFDVITIYGISYIMKNLEGKLQKELKKTARVISNSYSFKTWKPKSKENFVYVYNK